MEAQTSQQFSTSSLASALDRVREAIILTDRTQRVSYLNGAACRLLGIEHTLAIGSRVQELADLRSEDARPIKIPFERITSAADYQPSETIKLHTRNGDAFPIELCVARDEDQLIWTITPINGREEIARQIILQARLLDHVNESVIAADLDATILYWNLAAERLYGWKAEEVVGKNLYDVVVPLASREAAHDAFRKWAVHSSRVGESIELRKDGTTFVSYVRISPVYNSHKEKLGFVGLARDLTLERQSHDKLDQSVSLLTATLQSTVDGILAVNTHGKVTAWNDQFVQLWRIPSNVIGNGTDATALDVVLDQLVDEEAFLSRVNTLYSEPDTESFDTIHFKDGRIFERSSKPQRVDGKPVGRVWSFRDVTDLYTAQEELREQKSLYESLLNMQSDMGEGLAILSPTKVFYVNEAIQMITGYAAEELYGFTNILDIVDPSERGRQAERLAMRMRGENVPAHYATKIVHKSGRIVDVEIAVKRRETQGGVQLVILMRDISHRMQVERSLVASEAKFRTVVDNLGEAIAITDKEDRILYLNSTLEELSGYSSEECIGKNGPAMMTLPMETEANSDRLDRRLNGAREQYEVLLRRKNGELRWCSVNAVPYYDLEGEIIGTVAAITDIHDQKQRALELQRAEERFRYMTLATNDAVYDWSMDTNDIWWNDSFGVLFGYESAEDPSTYGVWKTRVHPGDKERVVRGLEHAIAEGNQTWSDEYRFLRGDGSYAFVIDRGYLIFDEEDKPSRMIGAMMDITDQKRAEDELKKAATNTSALIENTTDAILSVDKDLRLITFNSSFYEVFHQHNRIEPFPGMYLGDYFKDIESDYWDGIFSRALASERFTIERRRTSANLGERTFEMSFNPILESDELVGVAIFDKDITERKNSEEALKRSKANLNALIENTHDSIWSIDHSYHLLTFNSTFKKLFTAGHGIEPAEGMDLRCMLSGSEEEFWLERYQRALNGEHFTSDLEYNYDGQPLHFEVSFNPILTDGMITGAAIFTRNVTERKLMERQLIASKDRAEEMSRLKSSFLANMSHEIRTPMTAILGFASIIREYTDSTDLNEYANTIERSGKRLLSTINGILDLAKIESNKIEVNFQSVHPAHEITKAVQFFKPLAVNKGLELTHNEPCDCEILADEQYLGQILTNLIGNALKFTPRGEIRIDSGQNNDGRCYIRVSDTGIGIGKDFLPHIFDEFKQESRGYDRSYEGTGLGLTITKKLVDLMKGTITVESTLGEGSAFTVEFPLLKSSNECMTEDQRLAGEEKKDLRPALYAALPRILLVEDREETASLVNIFVRGLCELDVAVSAEDAFQKIAITNYDLLLMDVNLGRGLSGLDVTRELRTNPQYLVTPIIALTAYAMKGDRESAIAAGCSDYLTKPFSKNELVAMIQQFV